MSEEKKDFELNDEELEKVSGGGSCTFNGITYTDGDVYVDRNTPNFGCALFPIYIIRNCNSDGYDVERYDYDANTKIATFGSLYYQGASIIYLSSGGYVKANDIEILQFN